MSRIKFGLSAIAIIAVMGGCEPQKQPAQDAGADKSRETTVPRKPAADQWLGQWSGPEGTFLLLSKTGGKYVVKINSLDGLASYEGIGVGDHIKFQRDGKSESIRAGSGTDTGMKWLLDKKDCLIIKTGEGFCR
jgi:hypothetical protein